MKNIGYILMAIASFAILVFSLFTDPFTDGDTLEDFPFDKGVIIKTDFEDFQADVLEEKKPVLVVFWQEGATILKELEDLVRDTEVIVARVNITENPRLAQAFDLRALPAVFLFKDGELKEMIRDKDADYRALIEQYR